MILGVIQARFASSRLPGKVLKLLDGKPMLERVIQRAADSSKVDRWLVATTTNEEDNQVAELASRLGYACYRGNVHDVLDRFYQAASTEKADVVVRVTADCPLLDPELVDAVVNKLIDEGAAYASNTLSPSYPDGLDVEAFRASALEAAWKNAKDPAEREHVTLHIYRNPEQFRLANVRNEEDLSSLRWTVDYPEDLRLIEDVFHALRQKPNFRMRDVLNLFDTNPMLKRANQMFKRNEALQSAEDRYGKSVAFLARAEKVIPLGSQTFSKSRTQYPVGVSPLFIKKGKGSRVWDIDGNEYLDFNGSLCSVTLGYGDADVTAAVSEQLHDGIIFPLPHPLETEVAELLCDMIPCAEKVRFGKNGSDATSGAIRVARAYTKRDRVAVCGYHGWQDWYIGSTARNLGVPKATSGLTHPFLYNDLDSLAKIFSDHPDEVAAVILEPMNVKDPAPGFLEGVRELCSRKGALLVFDETITGFRFANGGAQQHFGVIPDIATFGKGLANGYPLSAVAGRSEYMKLMEEVFFSFTFGGECLSLAAAKATLQKLKREPVVRTMAERGTTLKRGVEERLDRHGLKPTITLSGNPAWSFLNFQDSGNVTSWHLKTLFLQETFARGVLTLGSHNLMYAHSEEDVLRLLNTYDSVFSLLSAALKGNDALPFLKTRPLEPLFKLR